MITKRQDTSRLAGFYAMCLTIYSSRDSMATTLQVGLVCRTALELADLHSKQGVLVDEPYEMITKLAASNLSSSNKDRVKAANDWARRRCAPAEGEGDLGVTYLIGEETNRRLKHYFLTEVGERKFNELQANFELAYLKPRLDITGFGLIRRD